MRRCGGSVARTKNVRLLPAAVRRRGRGREAEEVVRLYLTLLRRRRRRNRRRRAVRDRRRRRVGLDRRERIARTADEDLVLRVRVARRVRVVILLLGEELVADQLAELERRAGRRDADHNKHRPFERVGSELFAGVAARAERRPSGRGASH